LSINKKKRKAFLPNFFRKNFSPEKKVFPVSRVPFFWSSDFLNPFSRFFGTQMWLYDTLFVNPLRTLYLNGTTMLGFWNGQSALQICAQVTHQSELFWQQHPHDCSLIVEQRFSSALSTVQILLYFTSLWLAFSAAWSWARARLQPPTKVVFVSGHAAGRDALAQLMTQCH